MFVKLCHVVYVPSMEGTRTAPVGNRQFCGFELNGSGWKLFAESEFGLLDLGMMTIQNNLIKNLRNRTGGQAPGTDPPSREPVPALPAKGAATAGGALTGAPTRAALGPGKGALGAEAAEGAAVTDPNSYTGF